MSVKCSEEFKKSLTTVRTSELNQIELKISVFPIAIGRDFEKDSKYGQEARRNMERIKGKVTIEPIYLTNYDRLAQVNLRSK